MWRYHRHVAYSPQGFAKAMQAGADAIDLRESLSNCIMCGACDVMCPENIDLTGMVAEAWSQAGLPTPLQHNPEATGFTISCNRSVQARIQASDLYIIDAAPFHAHHAERVAHYTRLRDERGCSMNLDLHRMAIPTGAHSVSAEMGIFNVEAQIRWLIQGRDFERVIVENTNDIDAFAAATGKHVIHISALMEAEQHA